jgi:hypothetical protein
MKGRSVLDSAMITIVWPAATENRKKSRPPTPNPLDGLSYLPRPFRPGMIRGESVPKASIDEEGYAMHEHKGVTWVMGKCPVSACGRSRTCRANPHGDRSDLRGVVYDLRGLKA